MYKMVWRMTGRVLSRTFATMGHEDNSFWKNIYQIMYQMKKHLVAVPSKCFIFSVPGRVRTVDPLIKSQLLYQLSYRDFSSFQPG
jgi:hypothetical protein